MKLLDRWRIERAVWVVDTWISDLPRGRRRAIRQELRANMLASAEEVGAREAVRRLGPLQRLAVGYLDAEFGDVTPRPNWIRGLTWALAVEIALLAAIFAGMNGYTTALDAARASGTYDWSPLGPLGPRYTETRLLGQFDGFVIEFDLSGVLAIVGVLLLVFIVAGRTWRVIPARRRRASGPGVG
jgi:hypothetical protein